MALSKNFENTEKNASESEEPLSIVVDRRKLHKKFYEKLFECFKQEKEKASKENKEKATKESNENDDVEIKGCNKEKKVETKKKDEHQFAGEQLEEKPFKEKPLKEKPSKEKPLKEKPLEKKTLKVDTNLEMTQTETF